MFDDISQVGNCVVFPLEISSKDNKKNEEYIWKILLVILSCILMLCSTLSMCRKICEISIKKPNIIDVMDSIQRCNDTMHKEAIEESNRVNEIFERNNSLLKDLDIQVQYYNKTIEIIKEYISKYITLNKEGYPYDINSKCNINDINELKYLIDPSSIIMSSTYNITVEYVSQNEILFKKMIESMNKRIEYDSIYFTMKQNQLYSINSTFINLLEDHFNQLYNSIKLLNITEISECITINEKCSNNNGLYSILYNIKESIRNQWEDASLTYNLLEDRIDSYKIKIISLIDNIQSLYNTIDRFHEDLLNAGIDLGPLPSLSLPSLSIPIFPQIQLPELSIIYSSLIPILEETQEIYINRINEFEEKTRLFLYEYSSSFSSIIDFFDDYSPPNLNNTIFEEFQEESKQYIENTWNTMQNISNTIQTSTIKFGNTIQSTFNSVYNTLLETIITKWDTEDYEGLSFNISDILSNIDSIISLACYIDIIYRIIKIIQIINKILIKGNVNIKVISLYNENILNKMNDCNNTILTKILMLLIPYSIPILLIFIIIILILFGLIMLYIPFLNDFLNGCVYNTVEGDSISRNVYSFSYNYATIKGTLAEQSGLTYYKKTQKQYCDYWESLTEEQHIKDIQIYDEYIYWLSYDKHLIESLTNCTNINILCENDISFCNYMRNISSSSSSFILSSSSSSSLSLDTNNIYNCSKIPSCNLQCEGPNKHPLYTISKETTCKSEWFLHSYILLYSMSLLIWLIINISRYFYIESFKCFFYKQLSGNLFMYLYIF
ncbi:hypothetical protein WA158_008081 [Blastocystis sp. Blastoise]